MFSILIFIIVLSLLVFVHELGHFIVAKRSGMKVHEFGFGFPPRLIGLQRVNGKWTTVRGNKTPESDNTVYSINAIPLGGFVKIMGEDNDVPNDDPESFGKKSFIARFGTLVAGVLMNFILAAVLLSVGYMAGLPVAVQSEDQLPTTGTFSDRRVAIIDVQEDSPAQKAGLLPSDIIQSVEGQSFETVEALQNFIRDNRGKELQFNVQRVNELKQLKVQTLSDAPEGKGLVGVGLALYGKLKFAPHHALVQGTQTAYAQLSAIVKGLYHLFSTGDGVKDLGGPVKIAQLTGQVADLGIIPLLQFAAFLSLNLAVLNSLPFPALDGGRMLFLIIETIRGKRNNSKIEQYANAIGFIVLLLLMAVITVRDISQLETIKNLF